MATIWVNFKFCAQAVGASALPLLAPLGLYLQSELAPQRPQIVLTAQQPLPSARAAAPASKASVAQTVLKL